MNGGDKAQTVIAWIVYEQTRGRFLMSNRKLLVTGVRKLPEIKTAESCLFR